MPTLALLLLQAALGMLTASLAAQELRASTRAVQATEAFRALAAHSACLVFPPTLFLLLRHTDWMVSYRFDGATLPSAVALLLALVAAAAPLAGFALGGAWVRAHDARRPVLVAGAITAAALFACFVFRARVGHVGSWVQYRGGFGLQRITSSPLMPVLTLIALAQGAAWAWLVVSIARRRE
ncbi:MAG: hypothetical protein R3A48_01775 [Polyangiales bacterium]